MSGLSYQEVSKSSDRSRLLFASAMFVVGFSIVFVAYGAAASSLGSLVVENRQWLTRVSGVLVIAMGFVVAGVFRPMALMRERRFYVTPAALGPYAAPVMGMAFAFGWTPCIGPILASVLTLAAARETLSDGVWLLVAYSAGLGVPFVLSGVAFGSLRNTFAWFGKHARAIDRIAGGLLVVFGTLLLTNNLTQLSAAVTRMWTFLGLDRLTLG